MENSKAEAKKLKTIARNTDYVLRLFVTGATPNSVRAVSNIKLLCETHLAGKYSLEIIDLYDKKELAEQEQIVAVPMLVKDFPLPIRKLIGDLSNNIKVLDVLGLKL
jgi:circadian clock protein KaiB